MTRLGFIGFGLIGASVAKSLKQKKSGKYEIYVYDYHKDLNPSLEKALSDGTVDSVRKDFDELINCDIILLCAPTLKNIQYLKILKDEAEKRGLPLPLISDVGSVKGNIVKAAAELGIEKHFIGGHPMAGSEKTGYVSANDHLLENAYYILTPTELGSRDDLLLLKELVIDTGAIPVILDPEKHDRVTAAISHLPHIAAAELVNIVSGSGDDEETMRMLAAGGFKDITRIASSSPDMWRSILLSNKDAIIEVLERYQDALVRIEAAIMAEDDRYIYKSFEKAGDYRRSIPDANGMLPKSYRLYVDIEDRMGAIATIATLLFACGVSIKNIGIVHNREHEEGVLRVEFYDEASYKKAGGELKKHSYTIYEV